MRVYYVNGYANEVYYVRAENEEEAEKLLRKEIGKHVFRSNLYDDADAPIPEKLGENIIVEFGVTKGTLESDLRFDDMTATAYIFSENGMEHWKDWDITTEDVIGDKNLAEALEKQIYAAEEEVKKDDV